MKQTVSLDPTEALAYVRNAAEDVRKHMPPPGEAGGRVNVLIQGFDELDGWLSHGGMLPQQWRSSPGRPQMTEDGPALEGVVHGKRSSYNRGCHERLCRRANTLRRDLTDAEIKELSH